MKRRTKEKELADNARLLRAWRDWHREQLEEALAGVHGAVLERLMNYLKDLHAARELVDFIAAQNWAAADSNTRLIALHEINKAITREERGLPPISDSIPWTGEKPTAFEIIRNMISAQAENAPAHPPATRSSQ